MITLPCTLPHAFEVARRVEHWPGLLPHYRWVRFHRGDSEAGGLVEMAAQRRFGAAPWPVWWLSEMAVDAATLCIRYRHRRGVTRGMDVVWRFAAAGEAGTQVRVVHRWERPGPGRWTARHIIGPHFVWPICEATLTGLKRWTEAVAHG